MNRFRPCTEGGFLLYGIAVNVIRMRQYVIVFAARFVYNNNQNAMIRMDVRKEYYNEKTVVL